MATGKEQNWALVPNPIVTISVPNTDYDTTKISSVSVKKIGHIVSGKIIIIAAALASGYNAITFSIPNITWALTPCSACWTDGAGDVSKNFYCQISGSAIYVMASASNASTVTITFTGMAQ